MNIYEMNMSEKDQNTSRVKVKKILLLCKYDK